MSHSTRGLRNLHIGRRTIAAGAVLSLWLGSTVWGQDKLIQVHHDFAVDPGWEGLNNRIVCDHGPTITQDFGWRATNHLGCGPGEIGGTIHASTRSAYYGMPIGPLSLEDKLSASGRVCIRRAPGRSCVYLGFFNSTRQGWRPWSSLMIQMTGSQRGERLTGKQVEGVQIWLTSVTATWRADGIVTDVLIPADGSVHTWRLEYDPDARIDTTWPHANMAMYFPDARLEEDAIFEIAGKLEPGLERVEVRRRLETAAEQGLIVFDPRRGTNYWERVPDVEKCKGAVTLRVDDGKPQRGYLAPGHRDEPAVFDRFGVVNQATYGRGMVFYVGDLTVNGHKIDLSRDPGWDGSYNRVTFTERDFHGRQDFGFSETHWAGEAPGEIGGAFWRTEPVDPSHGYYADEVGRLTLDDPISFSGTLCFVDGQPDASMWFGYFSAAEQRVRVTDETAGFPLNQTMGIQLEDLTRIGWYFTPFCAPTRALYQRRQGPIVTPDRRRRRFAFRYDPRACEGLGRIEVSLDEQTMTLDLTRRQRAAGATFDRFGLVSVRRGGKLVRVYLDDLTYTARRRELHRSARHERKTKTVPYPEGGRRY